MRRTSVAAVFACAVLVPSVAHAIDVQACLSASERGQRARAAGKLREARDQFSICTAEGCPQLVRKDCGQWSSDVAAVIPSVVFGAKDAKGRDLFDVTVSADGEVLQKKLDGKAVALDPGPHTFRFEMAGAAAVTERALVKEGERARVINVVLTESAGAGAARGDAPADADRGTSKGGHTIFPWIVVGIGAVGLVGGLVWFATAPSLPSGCDSKTAKCARFTDDTDASFKSRQETAGRSDGQPLEGAAIMAAGGGLVLVGLLWHFLEPSASSSARTQVVPWATAHASGVSLEGRF